MHNVVNRQVLTGNFYSGAHLTSVLCSYKSHEKEWWGAIPRGVFLCCVVMMLLVAQKHCPPWLGGQKHPRPQEPRWQHASQGGWLWTVSVRHSMIEDMLTHTHMHECTVTSIWYISWEAYWSITWMHSWNVAIPTYIEFKPLRKSQKRLYNALNEATPLIRTLWLVPRFRGSPLY